MSQKAIREYDGKNILSKYIQDYGTKDVFLNSLEFVQIKEETNLVELVEKNPWLLKKKLVGKINLLK
jgi:hypothetical protein